MPSPAAYRVGGHVVALGLHLTNTAVILGNFSEELLRTDPNIRNLHFMQFKFLTTWNMVFQLMYATLGLVCDSLTLLGRDDVTPKTVRKLRNAIFESIVCPYSLFIVGIFWSLYNYNRDWLYPEYIDKVVSFNSNLVMHFAILPVVLWELSFQERTRPKSDKMSLQVITALYIVYNLVILYTYFQRNLWPYPLIYQVFGTVLYPILVMLMLALIVLSYYVQWEIHAWIWRPLKVTQKNN
ncbi:androgen-dependent TFPI-regulating protein [Bombyx mori]|uniref:Androgen-dependent TFPI-regulating protein-like n=1 Tax=Bombyx mori TaxID=7091 RepID=A0A8R2AQP9_BOMMO|nr:androgen-dependent TFPI-regulating protein [Bombyx mori]